MCAYDHSPTYSTLLMSLLHYWPIACVWMSLRMVQCVNIRADFLHEHLPQIRHLSTVR